MASDDEPHPRKRLRRGGINQRLLAVEKPQPKPKDAKLTSKLAESLVEKWAWGQLSPQEVQELAFKATVDFQEANAAAPLDLQFLASLGTAGAHKLLARVKHFLFLTTYKRDGGG